MQIVDTNWPIHTGQLFSKDVFFDRSGSNILQQNSTKQCLEILLIDIWLQIFLSLNDRKKNCLLKKDNLYSHLLHSSCRSSKLQYASKLCCPLEYSGVAEAERPGRHGPTDLPRIEKRTEAERYNLLLLDPSDFWTFRRLWYCYVKGQLISKGLFKVSICTKKCTKIFLYFCPSQ